MPARIALALAWWLAATGCASLSTNRNTGLLTISIEGEAHEMQTFQPIRPRPESVCARPFLIIRASDVAVLRPPGKYWLHLVPATAVRNYVVLALGDNGDRTARDVVTLAPHRDRISAGPYSMNDRWEWRFYAVKDDRRLQSDCRQIQ